MSAIAVTTADLALQLMIVALEHANDLAVLIQGKRTAGSTDYADDLAALDAAYVAKRTKTLADIAALSVPVTPAVP